jgi:dTDP-4-amino-4,6-dideoxygalactose transaminase
VIRFLDLKYQYEAIREEIDAATARFFDSGHYILGAGLREFEERFAEHVGVTHCVGVGSGLEALQLLLRAYGIGPGDEVIVPSNTYIATWLAVTNVGAMPVPVEPDLVTYNLDRDQAEAAISERTKALLPVHLYGLPTPMTDLRELCKAHGLVLLEDAAQAHGAKYREQRAGSLGHAGAFSFYPSKNLGAFGDGGAITTDDQAIAERVRLLRNYGSPKKYENEILGFNSRLDELQARLLLVKLRYLDAWNDNRRRQADIYLEELKEADVVLPCNPEWAAPVWHVFVIRVRAREALANHLADGGIETLIHYPIPPHLQPAYGDLGWQRGTFPVSEEIHETVLSLPIGPHLSDDDIRTVAAAVRDYAPKSALRS